MPFDPNRWVQKVPSNHVAYAVGLCFVLYYLQVIIVIAMILGILWAVSQIRENSH